MAAPLTTCPKCGMTIPSSVANCPRCGYDARAGSGSVTDRISWTAIAVSAGIVLILVSAVFGLLRSGKKPTGPMAELRQWLAAKDGLYLETPLDDLSDPEFKRQSEAGRIESHLLAIDGSRIESFTLITSDTVRSGEWTPDLEGSFDGSTWRTASGEKALRFDGTGLVEVDGRTYYKVPEAVNNNIDLGTIHIERENILAGKPPR